MGSRGRTLAVMLACGAACGGGCDPVEAADGPTERQAVEFRSERVDAALDRAGTVLRTRGFAPAEEGPWRGFLVPQGSAVRAAELGGEGCYVIVAAGSSSLRELDLRLFDSDGTELAAGGQTGPGAALRHCPTHGGTHYVAALAGSGAGLFAVRRYAGPTGLVVRLDDLFERPAPAAEPPGGAVEP